MSTMSESTHVAPYADLLSAYKDAEPLPETFNADGKSLYNPPGPLSPAYETFSAPIKSENNGFDFHGVFFSSFLAVVPSELTYFMVL